MRQSDRQPLLPPQSLVILQAAAEQLSETDLH
jgi:hypothetical protein